VPALLELERVAACACAHVDDAAADVAERPALMRGPATERYEIAVRPARRLDEAVIALDDLVRARLLLEVRAQQ
jgi:hypothetical protein